MNVDCCSISQHQTPRHRKIVRAMDSGGLLISLETNAGGLILGGFTILWICMFLRGGRSGHNRKEPIVLRDLDNNKFNGHNYQLKDDPN